MDCSSKRKKEIKIALANDNLLHKNNYQLISGSLPRNSETFREDDRYSTFFHNHPSSSSHPDKSSRKHIKIPGLYEHDSLIMSQEERRVKGNAAPTRQWSEDVQTRRKLRSSSFHNNSNENLRFGVFTDNKFGHINEFISDPEVSFRILQHQNRKQRTKLNEIQKIILKKLDLNKNSKKKNDVFSKEKEKNLLERDHLGCKIDLLNSKIDSQQLLVDSLFEKFDQVKIFDQSQLHSFLNQQMIIDQELVFEEEVHKGIGEKTNKKFSSPYSSNSKLKDEMIEKEIDDLKNRLYEKRFKTSINNSQQLSKFQSSLSQTLSQLEEWIEDLEDKTNRQVPIGGDLVTIGVQKKELQKIQQELDGKRVLVEDVVEVTYLVLQESFTHMEELENEITNKSCKKLEELSFLVPRRWIDLRQKIIDFLISIDSATKNLEILQKLLEKSEENLDDIKDQIFWLPPEKLGSDNLKSELNRAKNYQISIIEMKPLLDAINEKANLLQDFGLILSHKYVSRMEENGRKWKEMNNSFEMRIFSLSELIKTKNQSLEIYMKIPLQPPWEKSLTANNVPYYINHETETTHWDHPEMIGLMQDLSSLNAVKFSAYRSSMKLRMLQLRLRLSSLPLEHVVEYFHSLNHRPIESNMAVSDIVTWLLDLFKKDFSRCVPTYDLILNWLFNVYDVNRTGVFKVLSVKIALILLCSGDLEIKFSKLFELVSDSKGSVDPSSLSSLLLNCLMILQPLGEGQAFGGLDVESSIKSCFEMAMCHKEIKLAQFIEWIRLEPQSLVWLHVLQRLSSAERSIHQAKCALCKIFPITGFRYRCLKCFNFDMCQNCFFSGGTTKHHKLNHPMQEYINEATSGEDMRDLKTTLKNKFRSKEYFKKHPRIGYLPVVHSGSQVFESGSLHLLSPQLSHVIINRVVGEGVEKDYNKYKSMPTHNFEEHKLIAEYCMNLQSIHGEDTRNEKNEKGEIDCNNTIKVQVHEIKNREISEDLDLQNEISQLKLVKSEPSLYYREISVDGGDMILNMNNATKKDEDLEKERKILEMKINELEDENKIIEIQLDRMRREVDPVVTEAPISARIISYSEVPQTTCYSNDMVGGYFVPPFLTSLPPPFISRNI